MHPATPCVAYVVSRWGEPTQTFVRREAGAVLAAGGAVRVFSMRRPRPTGLDVEVVYVSPPQIAVRAGTTLIRHPRIALAMLARIATSVAPRNLVRQLAACLIGFAWASEGIDATVLHAHFGWVAATAAWSAGRTSGHPFTVVLHAFELHAKRYDDRFTPIPLRAATAVYTISVADAALVRERWGVAAVVLRMGVSDEWLAPATVSANRDQWLVVSVGSLVPKKGHADLLAALAVADERWRLVVVGDGPEADPLAERVVALGLGRRVEFAGARAEQEVRDLMQRAAVVALASTVAPDGDRDGIPVALMEAMACGTPVVTTRVGGIDELVEGCGLLVPPGQPHLFAHALDRLRDPRLREALAAKGRERVEEEFSAAIGGRQIVVAARTYGS